MEQKKPLTHITAGLLIAAFLVVYSIFINFLGIANNPGISLIQNVIIIGGLIFVVMQHGKDNNYQLSFGNLFAFGFKTTTVFTLIFIAFTVIFFLLFPELKEKTFEIARSQLEKNDKLTEEQIDQALEISRRFFWVGVVGGSMFFMVLIGAIGSLLGAAFTKKRPQNPFEQQSA